MRQAIDHRSANDRARDQNRRDDREKKDDRPGDDAVQWRPNDEVPAKRREDRDPSAPGRGEDAERKDRRGS